MILATLILVIVNTAFSLWAVTLFWAGVKAAKKSHKAEIEFDKQLIEAVEQHIKDDGNRVGTSTIGFVQVEEVKPEAVKQTAAPKKAKTNAPRKRKSPSAHRVNTVRG